MLRIARLGGKLLTAARCRGASTMRVINVGSVVTPSKDGKSIEVHRDSELVVRDGKVSAIEKIGAGSRAAGEMTFDARGGLVTPGMVDAHTHLFPPVDRANEFAMRSVKSYKEIAAAGGGILSSVRGVREGSAQDLFRANLPLMEQFFANGTTTVEVKSGYGLTTADELKTLEAIAMLQTAMKGKLTIVPTFMGAHAFPPEYKGGREDEYVDLVCNEMIPAVAKQGVAKYCDVFCEEGYFSAAHTQRILEAARKHGMQLRIHADEFVDSGGATLAAKMKAHSADHLMAVSDEGIKQLAASGVVPIVLPGATVFLGKGHGYAPMRKLVDAGCDLAIATDFNPGSSVHQSLPQMMQLCMANGGLTLNEALLGVTHNAAKSLGLAGTVGTLQPGANADFIVWSLENESQIPYFGPESRSRIQAISKNGEVKRNPAANLRTMHSDAFTKKTAAAAKDLGFSQAPREAHHASVEQLQHTLTDFISVNERGQITELPRDCDLSSPPPAFDPNVPHAPIRLTRLNAKEEEMAVDNALKYFHKDLHDKLRPVAMHELKTYGHIYFYHLMPRQHVWALAYDDAPCKTLEARAMLHMILNNLDPRVAQFPQELITYGGNGAVFSNWAQFHITVRLLNRKHDGQTLCMNSGHPSGLFPKRAESDSPAAVISNGMMIPRYSTPEQLDRLYALGVTMYGQMTAGSWMYIGPQGIVHGTTLTVAQAVALQAANAGKPIPDGCKGKIFVTSGLGGMSGAQPKAATINGAVCIVAEVDPAALKKRHAQKWLNEYYTDLPSLMKRAAEAQANEEAVSIGYLGNIVDVWEYMAATPIGQRPEIVCGSDQTSLHNPYNGGYYPVGLSFEESNEMMHKDPDAFKKAVQRSLHRHIDAIEKLRQSDQMLFFDYGNAFLLECHNAGCHVDPNIPSYVECIMGPEFFDYGFGPYRWVCTSGNVNELEVTDRIAEEVILEQMADETNSHVLPQLRANLDWIQTATANNLVVGSAARILYTDTEGRIECAVRMNRAVAAGILKAPVVIGRDHHDVSGTDAPWRETANIKDGSNLTADMSVQNVIGDAMRGATWVSLHNGGGTGWGVASNGGFGLVLDGTERAEQRARDMIFFDVANGLTRRARAGNPHAMQTIAKLAEKFPDYRPFYPAV